MALIGVFDSGVGGLTVLKTLAQQFPFHDFIYLGDTARLPYGSKSPLTIRKYSEQVMENLASRKVEAIVIACNSASSQISEKKWKQIPLFNVIDPGARAALQASQTKKIGILGTRATVNSGIYAEKIKALEPSAQTFSQSCPLFVPLVEEAWIDDPVANLIVYRYVQPLMQHQIDTVILGCTHYPLLASAIQKALGSGVKLVDSAHAISDEMRKDFSLETENKNRKIQLLLTDFSPHSQAWAEEIFLPLKFTSIEVVDLI